MVLSHPLPLAATQRARDGALGPRHPLELGSCGSFARQGCPQGQAGQGLSRHRCSWVSSDPGEGPQALLWGEGTLFGDSGGTTGHPSTELGKTSTAKGQAGGPGAASAGPPASWPPCVNGVGVPAVASQAPMVAQGHASS